MVAVFAVFGAVVSDVVVFPVVSAVDTVFAAYVAAVNTVAADLNRFPFDADLYYLQIVV